MHGNLALHIRENTAKVKSEAKEIASQILEGLVVLHERGICHHDLKPQVSRQSHDTALHITDKFCTTRRTSSSRHHPRYGSKSPILACQHVRRDPQEPLAAQLAIKPPSSKDCCPRI